MKRIKSFGVLSIILIMLMVMTACGKSESKYDAMDTATSEGSYTVGRDASGVSNKYDTDTAVPETAAEMAATDAAASTNGKTADIENPSALTSGDLQAQSQDKIIKNYYLEVETQSFDDLIKNINSQIKSLGGYIESSQIGGKSYYESNVTRNGNIVARIPADKADEFVNTVDKTANVKDNQLSTENVTLQYVDTQSKIEALKIEQERLYAILEKADDLDSIITLESRLSDIRYELGNYESQLRVYDNKVQYSTVTLNISEVERITPDTKAKPTFTSRIQNGFSDTIYHIGEGFKNFIVWFIVNLPYLFIWGIIIFLIVFVTRRIIRKTGQKKNAAVQVPNGGQNFTMQQNTTPQENNTGNKQ